MAKSKGKKILIGCGIGCAALLVLVVGGCVGFTFWLTRPGELLEPERLLADDTLGYVEWTLREEDPGTAAFASSLLERSQQLSREQNRWMPGGLSSFLANQQRKSNEEQIRQMLPMVAAWVLHEGDTEQHHVWTFSVQNMGNRMRLLDWIMGRFIAGSDELQVIHHRGEKLYHLADPDVTIFLRGNDIFITDHIPTGRLTVDRLLGGGTGGTGSAPVQPLYDALPAESMLRGAIVNRSGELLRIWDTISRDDDAGDPRVWDAIRSLSISGGLAENASIAGTLEFAGPDSTWAAEHATKLEEMLRLGLRLGHIRYELQSAAVGDKVRIDFTIPDLGRQLEQLGP